MYEIVEGSTHGLSDVEAFLKTLDALDHSAISDLRGFFSPDRELILTRAPGRLDVMGGIADYSGSLVLQLPIREATIAAFQRDDSRMIRIVSLGAGASGQPLRFEMPVSDFESGGSPIEYDAARDYFRRSPDGQWAAYVAGGFIALMRELGIRFVEGARILIHSRVPGGKGLSSSAALEVASMQAAALSFGLDLTPVEIALLSQKVENLVVGAPCGVMDQMTAMCGEAHRLVSLLCQPAQLGKMTSVPDHIALWGIDSGIRHSVAGADYASVRVGAFMGYRIIAELAGLIATRSETGQLVQIQDPVWGGYLANIAPSEFEQSYGSRLPEQMKGSEFLARYGGATDPVTGVDPDRTYAVRVPTAHPIYENFRVRTYAELLEAAPGERRIELLGELMYQSHASYSACGLGSPGTDLLVDLVRRAGPAQGVYGAKITGGGSGGTVAVIGRPGVAQTIAAIADRYEVETGYRPHVVTGSSPGAAVFGHLRLVNRAG